MARKTFVSPDGRAVVTLDAGIIGDSWTLSVGQEVVAAHRVGLLSQLKVGLGDNFGGWGSFELRGGGYSVGVMVNVRTRQAIVDFHTP